MKNSSGNRIEGKKKKAITAGCLLMFLKEKTGKEKGGAREEEIISEGRGSRKTEISSENRKTPEEKKGGLLRKVPKGEALKERNLVGEGDR